jgi:RNA polymerase sigma-70 factor (ECF subfamily)
MGSFSVATAGSIGFASVAPPGDDASGDRASGIALQQASSGDRDRLLRGWVDQHLDFVARVLRNAGTPAAEVDDAVQRVFIVAARRFADVAPGSERGFLLGIALNEAAHARRSAARRREVPQSELPERVDGATPEQLTGLKRDRQLLELLLDQLEPDLRTVFVLFEFEELTMAEIKNALGIPAGTVASRLRRAREQFRLRLAALRARQEGKR